MADALHWFQLAGPAVRPSGHPAVGRVLPELLIGEYPTPDDAEWLCREQGVTAVVSLQDDIDLARKGLEIRALERAYYDRAASGPATDR